MATLNVSDLNRQGKVYTTANAAAASVLAVSTTMTGLILINPPASGRKLILIHTGFAWTTAGAAAHQIGIAIANSGVAVTNTTPGVVTRADGTSGTGVGQSSVSATLPVAGVAVRWIGGSLGTAVSPYQIVDYTEGGVILSPGAYAHLTTVTTTAVGIGSFSWAEVPA